MTFSNPLNRVCRGLLLPKQCEPMTQNQPHLEKEYQDENDQSNSYARKTAIRSVFLKIDTGKRRTSTHTHSKKEEQMSEVEGKHHENQRPISFLLFTKPKIPQPDLNVEKREIGGGEEHHQQHRELQTGTLPAL